MPAETCVNCHEPVVEAFPGVWHHPRQGNHTVCNWYKGMPDTDRVATPERVEMSEAVTSRG